MSKMTVEKNSDRDGVIFEIRAPDFSLDQISVVSEDYARRIAACWNAFQSFSTDDIERCLVLSINYTPGHPMDPNLGRATAQFVRHVGRAGDTQ